MNDEIRHILEYLDRFFHPERGSIVASIQDLQAAVARLTADVEKLIALATPPDFQAEVDALNASADAAEAAIPPPPAEPAA